MQHSPGSRLLPVNIGFLKGQSSSHFEVPRDKVDAFALRSWLHFETTVRLAALSWSQTMYSGVLGTELTAQIYMGVVYYQRLRHMVSDKFQVSCPTREPT